MRCFDAQASNRLEKVTPSISESKGNLKNVHIVNKAGLFHILFGLNKFEFSSVL